MILENNAQTSDGANEVARSSACLPCLFSHVGTTWDDMNRKLSRSKTGPIILSSMPCSLCGSWETNPSWHRCDTACLNPQGVAKLHTGNEIRCSRSWDGTCWFFFCNRCKTSRPHIIGVLRNVRIWHNPYSGKADYTTDSEEYSYYSSEGESCTQEEAE